MKTTWEYDQDPRYGYLRIDTEESHSSGFELVVTDTSGGTYGFTYSDGKMEPTCICSAWSYGECCCSNVDSDYWEVSEV